MKIIAIFLLLSALALPVSASTALLWIQSDIPGHNLTLNYTSSFNVARNDILGITIANVGNESLNDTITVNGINVSDASKAQGEWTGSMIIEPNSSRTIDFVLNVTTDGASDIDIKIYYNVSSDHKTLVITAHYPGVPEITSLGNSKTNSDAQTLSVNTSEAVRFNVTSDQRITEWNWFRDNVRQAGNYDNFSTSWDSAGTRTVSVNATNGNGTSAAVTWTVIVNAPSGVSPIITSWSNSKTGDNDLSFTINESETVKFNFTANQMLTSWLWTLNGSDLTVHSDNLTYTFNEGGSYRVGANGSNANGSTQTIVWNVTVLGKEEKKKNATLLEWSPQVVDYVYVDSNASESIEYYITTAETMTSTNWTFDGTHVNGDAEGTTYSYTHTWGNDSVGFHTIVFRGSNADTKVEFRWYVNVYETGGYGGGNLFDVIDDALENHVTDLKIRMFKYKATKHDGKSAIAAQKVNQLHDEIAKRQMTREALRKEFKAGNITIEEYTAALKQVQRDAKYNSKLAEGMAKVAVEDLKDEESGKQFKDLSKIENEKDKKKDTGNKGKSSKKNKENKKKGRD